MTASRSELIRRRLRALESLTPELEGAALVSFDGLMIVSCLPDSLTDDLMAAMAAAMLALGERIAKDLRRGALSQVFIKGDEGYVLMMAVDDKAVLTTLLNDEAKLGLVLLDMRRAVKDLRQLL